MPSTPGRRPYCYRFLLARLSILPWGNGKTYSISCAWWILRLSRVWPFAWRPCQYYLEACLWYSDFQQEHLKPNAKCFLLNYPNTVVWVISWDSSPPLPKWFLLSILSWISCSACPWEGYTPGICVKHIFLSIDLFNLPCDPYDLSSNILLLM